MNLLILIIVIFGEIIIGTTTGFKECFGTYDIKNGDTCQSIANKFNLKEKWLLDVDCRHLIPGENITVCQPSHIECEEIYEIRKSDTCLSLSKEFEISIEELTKLYKLNCKHLELAPPLCITHKHRFGRCSSFYTVKQGDTCESIMESNDLSSWELFYFNPSLLCSHIIENQTICLDLDVPCSNYADIKKEDVSSSSIMMIHALSEEDLKLLNPKVKFSKKNLQKNQRIWKNKSRICVQSLSVKSNEQIQWGKLLLQKDQAADREDKEPELQHQKRDVESLCGHWCSIPSNRDLYKWPSQFKYAKLKFIFYRPSSATLSQQNLDRQLIDLSVARLTATYTGAKVGFVVSSLIWMSGFSDSHSEGDDDFYISHYSTPGYFNIHVFSNLIGGYNGYAYFPGSSRSANLFLRYDKLDDPTLPHEFGHSLGLLHTHDSDCGCPIPGDFVEDVPPTIGWSTAFCTWTNPACNGVIPPASAAQNLMSYSTLGDWTCRKKFSFLQFARVRCFAEKDSTLSWRFSTTSCPPGKIYDDGKCVFTNWKHSGVGAPLSYHYYFDRVGGKCDSGAAITGLAFARGGCLQSAFWNAGNQVGMCAYAGDTVEGLFLQTRCKKILATSTPTWYASGVGAPLPHHYYFDRIGGECPAGKVATGMQFVRGGCNRWNFWTEGVIDYTRCSPATDSNEGLILQLQCVGVSGLGYANWRWSGVGAPLPHHYYFDRIGAVCHANEAVAGVKFKRGGCNQARFWNDGSHPNYGKCTYPGDANEGLIMFVKCIPLTAGVSFVESEEKEMLFETQNGEEKHNEMDGVPIRVFVGSLVGLVAFVVVGVVIAVVVVKKKRIQDTEAYQGMVN